MRDGADEEEFRPRAIPAEQPRPPKMMQWLAVRGIGETAAEDLNIYGDVIWREDAGEHRPAICFPFTVGGQLIGNVYVFEDGKHKSEFISPTVRKAACFNIDGLADNDTAVVVDGVIEAAALYEAGVRCAITAPARDFREVRAAPEDEIFVGPLMSRLAAIKKFVLAFPNHEGGAMRAADFVDTFGAFACWRAEWPAEHKTGGKTFLALGAEVVHRIIETARGVAVKGLREIEKGALAALRSAPREKMFDTGLREIDQFLKYRVGQVVVVTGFPGDGKSQFVTWTAVQLAHRHGFRFAICSPEHGVEELAATMAEQWAGAPFKDYGPNVRGMPDDTLAKAEGWVRDRFVWIVQDDQDEPITADYVLQMARVARIRYNVRGLIIDPFNELEHARGRDESMTDYVGSFMRRLLLFARQSEMLIFLVAHPSKLQRDPKTQKRPTPTLHDISGSSNFWNKCSIGFTVYRPRLDDVAVQVIVEKVKRKDQGRAGIARLTWSKQTGRYESEVPDAIRRPAPDDEGY